MDHCLVTSHVKHKPPGYQSTKYKSSAIAATAAAPPLPDVRPGVVDHLAKAMKQGKEVYIAYANRNLNEKQARKIKPLEWIHYGEALKALCFKTTWTRRSTRTRSFGSRTSHGQ
jgi:predicted DNA-binding transcriptional regulator YafY